MPAGFVKSAFRPAHYPPPDRAEIAFAGRSNVGKSSLINVIVNRRSLAKTSSRPGRTQAINFYEVGTGLYLVDLPGYGYARVAEAVRGSWKAMVETYLKTRPNLRGVVTILDIRREISAMDRDLFSWLKHYGRAVIPVITKSDKLSRQQALLQARRIEGEISGLVPRAPILFSARTREGREAVWKAIEELIRS
jgi:GTP-binding protein